MSLKISHKEISVVGGAGHVGFPLGLVFSSKGFKVSLIDKHRENIEKINKGQIPFLEDNSQELLKSMIKKKKIFATNKLNEVLKSKYIISSLYLYIFCHVALLHSNYKF